MAYTWKKQASSAYGLSLTQLVLNAVMFAEELPEQYEGWMDYQKQWQPAAYLPQTAMPAWQ